MAKEFEIVLKKLELLEKEIALRLQGIEEILKQRAEPVSAYGKSTKEPLSVALNLRGVLGRSFVEIWVKSSDEAEFIIEGAKDGINYRYIDRMLIPKGGGENHDGFLNAYPVIRVSTSAPNDNEIEIVATAA